MLWSVLVSVQMGCTHCTSCLQPPEVFKLFRKVSPQYSNLCCAAPTLFQKSLPADEVWERRQTKCTQSRWITLPALRAINISRREEPRTEVTRISCEFVCSAALSKPQQKVAAGESRRRAPRLGAAGAAFAFCVTNTWWQHAIASVVLADSGSFQIPDLFRATQTPQRLSYAAAFLCPRQAGAQHQVMEMLRAKGPTDMLGRWNSLLISRGMLSPGTLCRSLWHCSKWGIGYDWLQCLVPKYQLLMVPGCSRLHWPIIDNVLASSERLD